MLQAKINFQKLSKIDIFVGKRKVIYNEIMWMIATFIHQRFSNGYNVASGFD